MRRIGVCLISGLVAAGILWLLAEARPTALIPFIILGVQLLSLVVTVAVARREGLRPIPWTLLAFAIGPFAWVAMAARARPEGGTGGVALGGLAIGFGLLIDAIVFGVVRIVPT